MIDREALEAALTGPGFAYPTAWVPIFDAARERLAQLPEQCFTCSGRGVICDAFPDYSRHHHDEGCRCLSCHGSGKVYPPELVGRLARIIEPDWNQASLAKLDWRQRAIAVLDGLNGGTK